MTTPPRQPRAIGGQFEYARRAFDFHRQRGATGTAGSVTTMGWIPPRVKRVVSPAASTPATTSVSPLNMVYRGEFNSAMNYNGQDVVIVSSGDNAGTYVAPYDIAASSVVPGSASSVWILIGAGSSANVWL